MKILQICPRVPFPPHDGGAIAMYDVAKELSNLEHEVTVLAVNTPKHYQKQDVLNGIAELICVDVNTNLSYFKAFLNLFKKNPYNFERFINKKFEEKLIQIIKGKSFDIIQIEGTQLAYYVNTIKANTKTPLVIRTHNVEYKIWQRLSYSEKNSFKKNYLKKLSKRIKKYEENYLNKFDRIIAISDKDKHDLEDIGIKTPIDVIQAGVDFERVVKEPGNIVRNSVFIIGSFNWQPNIEGLKWFLEKIWKKAKPDCPHLSLHIAGKGMPDWLINLKMEGIKVHGFVESAPAFIQNYDIMLVPLLSGSGMRIKILEGMALEKPILTTSVGAEGIEYANDKNIFIRDNAYEWIKFLKVYHEGKINTQSLSKNAYIFAKEFHDNKKIIHKFVETYRSLL